MSPVSVSPADAEALRAQLTDPSPMQRAIGLHALELAVADCCGHDGTAARLAAEVDRFTARGIPFYQPNDSNFRSWVDRAVAHWHKLHAPQGKLAPNQRSS